MKEEKERRREGEKERRREGEKGKRERRGEGGDLRAEDEEWGRLKG